MSKNAYGDIRRIVSATIWEDNIFTTLSDSEKLFFIYCFTNQNTTLLGIYKFNIRRAAYDLQKSDEEIIKMLDVIESKGLIKFDRETNEIAIRAWLKYGICAGGDPIVNGLNRFIYGIKSKDLIRYVYTFLEKQRGLPNVVNDFISTMKMVASTEA